jgi:hypothetical protein
VLDVDASARRVRVRGDYRHPRALHSAAMGSVRILPTGRVLVGWGDQPYATEFDGDGDLASDTVLPRGQRSYRSLRLPWNGSPRERPAIAARRTRRTDLATVYVSWSGATEVASWQISAQPRGGRLTPLAIVPKRGFETPISVATANGQVVATALDGSGRPLASSEPLRI